MVCLRYIHSSSGVHNVYFNMLTTYAHLIVRTHVPRNNFSEFSQMFVNNRYYVCTYTYIMDVVITYIKATMHLNMYIGEKIKSVHDLMQLLYKIKRIMT